MIDKNNFKKVLELLGFTSENNLYTKKFKNLSDELFDTKLQIDFNKKELIYPEDKGLKVNERQTCNFSSNENFVVFECVNRLLEKGYKSNHIEVEPKWKVGHGASGGRADILIKDNSGKALLIIECKTSGKEFDNAWKETCQRPTQLFSYAQQVRSTQFICLYASDFIVDRVESKYHLITLKDNEKLLEEVKDENYLSYKEALDVEDIFRVWKGTYELDHATQGIFEKDVSAYYIGKHKYSVEDLSEINHKDIQGKYHEFATILRQHNVSGRENAFDKLINLFLCKIVDETQNPDELKFDWKGIAYDNHFDLQDRLQLLYKAGMKEFLGEDVTYIDNKQIDDAFVFVKNDPDATKSTIKRYFRELKFFTNNDFASQAFSTANIEKEDLDQDDSRILSNMLNLSNINTPLYDPKDIYNPEKINSLFVANFNVVVPPLGGRAECKNPAKAGTPTVSVPESLSEFVTTAKLTDMLDFSRKEFNKAISLTPKKSITIDTKWPLVKLG